MISPPKIFKRISEEEKRRFPAKRISGRRLTLDQEKAPNLFRVIEKLPRPPNETANLPNFL